MASDINLVFYSSAVLNIMKYVTILNLFLQWILEMGMECLDKQQRDRIGKVCIVMTTLVFGSLHAASSQPIKHMCVCTQKVP